MKILVVVLLSLVASIHSTPAAAGIAQRREGIYAHKNPIYLDQAQGSVKVSFNPSQVEPKRYNYGSSPYQKSEFSHTRKGSFYPSEAAQSQLFNVGYSVRFTGDSKPVKSQLPTYARSHNLDAGEIITGTRKQNEEVQVPSVNPSPEEYTSLINSKQQKISGIKAKPQVFKSYPSPKYLLSQANLSPATQEYYRSLEKLRPQFQNTQELQQKYSWRSLSPGVEIIKSTEIPTGQKYPRSETSAHFSHLKTPGRSHDLDFANSFESKHSSPLYYGNVRTLPVAPSQNVPSLPIDTTLLKEDVPLQFDTRLVEDANRNQMNLYGNNKYSQTQDMNYLQTDYRTIPASESTQNKVFYQHEQLKDYQQDQNRFQFRIYGKPQALPINGYNGASSNEEIIRQPRYLSNLNTNLRPPPFNIQYQRLTRVC